MALNKRYREKYSHDFDIKIIPKNTFLFKGEHQACRTGAEEGNPLHPVWFVESEFLHWAAEFSRKGKICVYRTKHDLRLMKMTAHNLKLLVRKIWDWPFNPTFRKALESAFGLQKASLTEVIANLLGCRKRRQKDDDGALQRSSLYPQDQYISRTICAAVFRKNSIDGWVSEAIPHKSSPDVCFPGEVVLCQPFYESSLLDLVTAYPGKWEDLGRVFEWKKFQTPETALASHIRGDVLAKFMQSSADAHPSETQETLDREPSYKKRRTEHKPESLTPGSLAAFDGFDNTSETEKDSQ